MKNIGGQVLWIKYCAQNEKSIFLQARLSKYQPRLQVFNLKSKSRKLQEKLLRLNIAPKTKIQYSCRRGWDCLNLACGKVNLASKWRKLQEKYFELNVATKTKNQYSASLPTSLTEKLIQHQDERKCNEMSFWVTYLFKVKGLFVTCMLIKKTSLKKTR